MPVFKDGYMQKMQERSFIGLIISVGFYLCLIAWAMGIMGCAVMGETGDRVTVTGTPKGIRAFSDMTNGWIRTGKESPEQPSEYYAHRKNQMNNETAQKGQAVGFWQRLTN